jgi:AcrR family transcriptional regulator
MTGKERREQLLDVGRLLFAERGFDGTSIEEIAAQAGVSKPVVYEHFGGKEGLYAVVVDREVEQLLVMVTSLLAGDHTRDKFEAAAVSLLRYIDENADGFRILVRDSNPGSSTGTYGTLLSDIAGQVEYILADYLSSHGHDPKLAPLYAQMLVGMVAFTAQWWLDARKPKLEEVAANLIDLAWNGLSGVGSVPPISDRRSSQISAYPSRRRSIGPPPRISVGAPPAEAEVVIYLDEYSEGQLEAVQTAALQLGDELGYTDFILTDEQRGSIFRRLRGKLKTGLDSDSVQQKIHELNERSSLEIVVRKRAETDAIKASSTEKLITCLANVPNAVVRVGGILIVKQTDANGIPAVIARELSTREIRAFELNPGIQKDPHGTLHLLAVAVAQLEEDKGEVNDGQQRGA